MADDDREQGLFGSVFDILMFRHLLEKAKARRAEKERQEEEKAKTAEEQKNRS